MYVTGWINAQCCKISIVPVTSTRSIGALLDKSMAMEEHISTVVRSANTHIRRIGKISQYHMRNDTETRVHAFVTSRLDHLNWLLYGVYGVPKKLPFRLQWIQNTAARLVTRSKPPSHITPVLKALHWLSVEKRIQYNRLLLTYKCLHARAPSYLSDLLTCHKNLHKLRSSAKGPFLEQPTSHLLETAHSRG